MKAKHHFWSSLAAGGGLYWATGSIAAPIGAMIGGFFIDADHIIDQLWSIKYGAPFRQTPAASNLEANKRAASFKLPVRLLRPRKLLRLPLVFHSYELLGVMTVFTLTLQTPFLFGLLTGYVIHIGLDLMRHHHEFISPLFYLFSYRLTRGFKRDHLIKPEYL